MKKKFFIIVITIFSSYKLFCQSSIPDSYKSNMRTRWSIGGNIGHDVYPRPQFKRDNWTNLNGKWEYALSEINSDIPSNFDGLINVPFPIESYLSGVEKSLSPDKAIWYKRTLNTKISKSGKYLLNFGAIDYEASVYINGKLAGNHKGGYTPFTLDITNFLNQKENVLVVKVVDPTEGSNPHGKQTLNPQNIYYTPTSGIWQTVWLEHVSDNYISSLHSTPNINKEELTINIKLNQKTTTDLKYLITIGGKNISKFNIITSVNKQTEITTVKIPINNMHLWSPNDPFLYDLNIKLIHKNERIDQIDSYFGMRKINIQKDEKGMDRIFLNDKYTYNLGVLDQGFWPDGLYTAANDSALSYDIQAIKSMGFNTIRKHIKIEPERWYYYADKLGILVWQDFVNPPHNLPEGSESNFESEIKETIQQLYNHPSIIVWTLFNEGWGAFNQAVLTKLIKEYDPTRLINGHSGEMLFTDNILRNMPTNPWPNSDLVDIHSYPFPRNTPNQPGKAKVIGEFGGIGVSVHDHEWNDMQGWGYIQVNANELKKQYKQMIDSLIVLERLGLSASIYTQPFDVEGEENGLITYDREIIKIPLDTIQKINRLIASPTKEFFDPNFFIAKTMDPNDNDSRFEELFKLYQNGKRDSAFLRRLTLIAYRQKQQDLVTQIGNDFINNLRSPFELNNLKFIQHITRSTQDKGFEIFLKNGNQIDQILGKNTALYVIKNVLQKTVIPPYKFDPQKVYDWDKLQKEITEQFGEIGEEAILGRRLLEYSGFLGNTPNWDMYGKFYVLYFKKALKHPDFNINTLSWPLFENVTDHSVLLFAAEVVKYSIDNWDRSPETLDTYANLLYKTKQNQKAIEWESKALEIKKGTNDEHIFAETLQKMKDNKPTWPQNQN